MPEKMYFSFRARGISTPIETKKARMVLMKKTVQMRNA